MKKIHIDKTNLNVSRLSFGTSNLHQKYSKKKRLEILNLALDCGITHFDTSPLYGYGIAENDLGVVLNNNNNITVASKICLYPNNYYNNINKVWINKLYQKINKKISKPIVDYSLSEAEKSLERSLKNLSIETIDILFMHDPIQELFNTHEYSMWFENQKKLGKIKYFGLSGNPINFKKLIKDKSMLSDIIQSKDSLNRLEADEIIKSNKTLQFTFGYFYNLKINQKNNDNIIKQVINRNKTGSILFSSLNKNHIKLITEIINAK